MSASESSVREGVDLALIERLVRRAFVLTTQMIFEANHRDDKELGDPKVGGHPASCSGAQHILGALHLVVREGQDFICCKPHAAPLDHAFDYMLGLMRRKDGSWMSAAEVEPAMHNLRHFSKHGEPVFQSYHASSDPDNMNFLPSGSVGIPPVNSAYLALAYRFAAARGFRVPENAHFWSLIGDSEFREGSLMECMPDVAERELGNVTWIVDYNRQNLDGARIPNDRGLRGTDAARIKRSSAANGWEVIDVRHGRFREEVFRRPGGEHLRRVLEEEFSDYQFHLLLLKRDAKESRRELLARDRNCARVIDTLDDRDLLRMQEDLGGHDLQVMIDALLRSKEDRRTPTLIIAHTIKGYGLDCFASQGNHSTLPSEEEVDRLLAREGLTKMAPYALYSEGPEKDYLDERGAHLRSGLDAQAALRDDNAARARAAIFAAGDLPETVEVEQLRNVPVAHTQWMWGQLAGKLIRIGVHEATVALGEEDKPLSEKDKRWEAAARYMLTMSPDVGTSTNLNPSMDSKVFAPETEDDLETKWAVVDKRRPLLRPHETARTSHLRFEIAEQNCMSAVGSFGKLGDLVGVPLLPMMTVYDFFIKRALDQLYYNLYWASGFILVGTPSGVTLSPEGAQHSWKSDIQIPNMVTWEPTYAIEVDWIVSDAARRHFAADNAGRQCVLVRAVTRGLDQKEMLKRLHRHGRFKTERVALAAAADLPGTPESAVPPIADTDILAAVRADCLKGAWHIVDYRGYADYRPGDNVVKIVTLGAMTTEALAASDMLLAEGIYADVIIASSPDLLLGVHAHKDGYEHLVRGLGIDGVLHLYPDPRDARAADLLTLAGGRIPIVAVVDGEPGIVDNIGSIVGVRQETLGLRKFSKCGRPSDVYAYHHFDGPSIAATAKEVLAASAESKVVVHRQGLAEHDDAARRG